MDDERIDSNKKQEEAKKSYTKALQRFFSIDSDINMTQAESPVHDYNWRSKEFLLKILQLLIGITCAALHSEGVIMMQDSITSPTFTSVVFSSFIIITAVIVLGYVLGHVMPDILIRMFNSIGMILYFTAATVSITVWCKKIDDMSVSQSVKKCMLIEIILGYMNCVFYGIDMGLSIKKALHFENL